MTKVLVTGATGFMGGHLLPALLEQPHQVRCLVRRDSRQRERLRPYRRQGLRRRPVELADGDVRDPHSLAEAMAGVDAVVHLVAVIRERPGATFEEINHLGTRNVVQAARQKGVKRLVHISALGAGPNPNYPYSYSKWLGEEEVRRSGLDYTILRPAVLFGKGAGFIESIKSTATMMPPFVPIPGTGRTKFQPLGIDDLVACILGSLEGAAAIGQTIEIGGPEHLTYEQVLDLILETLRLWRIRVYIPLALMRPAAAVMQSVWPNPPVTTVELAQLEIDNITVLDSVERAFGFRPARLRDRIGYLRG